MKLRPKKSQTMNWVNDYTDEQLSVIYKTICGDYAIHPLTLGEKVYKIDK